MNTDIKFFGKNVDNVAKDLERIVSESQDETLKAKHKEELRKHVRLVDGIAVKFRELADDKRKRRPEAFKPEDETKINDFLEKCTSLVARLNSTLATFEETNPVKPARKPKGKTEKVSSPKKKSPSKNTTRKAKPADLEKEQKKQEKLLAKEAEKQEKLLAKEKEKQEKLLAKEKEKQLAKERAVATKKKAAVFEPEQILKDNVATFMFKKPEFQTLTNFWPCLVTITEKDDVYQYSSGEHAFHGEKFRRLSKLSKNTSRKAELLRYSKQFLRCNDGGISALDAKRKSESAGLALTAEELTVWDKLSLKVQKEINGWKATIPEVRADLANTGKRKLVQTDIYTTEKDMEEKIWDGKAIVNEKGKVEIVGKNMMGRIWMEIREKM
jgi:hypothetical protein